MDLGAPAATLQSSRDGASSALTGPAGGFFERAATFFSDSFASLAANGLLFAFVLAAVVLGVALALLLAGKALFRRLALALREKTVIRGLSIRSLQIISAHQLREALLAALAYLRLLAMSAIVGLAICLLTLIVSPASAGQSVALVRGLWLSLAALLAWIVVVRAFRSVESSLLGMVEAKSGLIKPLTFKSFTVLSAPMIARAILLAIRAVGWALLLVSIILLLTLVLGFYQFTWSWSRAILGFLSGLLGPIASAVIGYVPKLLFAAVIIVIARIILRLLKSFFTEVEAGRLGLARFDKDWARTTYKLLRLVVIIFAFIMVFPYIPGSGSEAFRSVAVFLGVLLSLGSSSFVGNMMAGIALTYMTPFRLGDRVKIGETVGDVVERTLLVTRVRTIKNVVVTIPNAIVLSREAHNYSSKLAEGPLLLHTAVTIGYDVPWREVHAALVGAARGVKDILADPPPFVLQTALGNYSVAYELNAATDTPSNMAQIYSDLHRSIQDSFAKAGIEIMTPSFHALRDGSASTIPPEPPDPDGRRS